MPKQATFETSQPNEAERGEPGSAHDAEPISNVLRHRDAFSQPASSETFDPAGTEASRREAPESAPKKPRISEEVRHLLRDGDRVLNREEGDRAGISSGASHDAQRDILRLRHNNIYERQLEYFGSSSVTGGNMIPDQTRTRPRDRILNRQVERSILESPAWQSQEVQASLTELMQKETGTRGWDEQAFNALREYQKKIGEYWKIERTMSEEEFFENGLVVHNMLQPGGRIFEEWENRIEITQFTTKALIEDNKEIFRDLRPLNDNDKLMIWSIVEEDILGIQHAKKNEPRYQQDDQRLEVLREQTLSEIHRWRNDPSRRNAD